LDIPDPLPPTRSNSHHRSAGVDETAATVTFLWGQDILANQSGPNGQILGTKGEIYVFEPAARPLGSCASAPPWMISSSAAVAKGIEILVSHGLF
jgi:hypothetical protein